MSSTLLPSPASYSNLQDNCVMGQCVIALRDPTTNDDYISGTFWSNISAGRSWQVDGYVSGRPQWKQLSAVTGTTGSMSGTPGAVTVSNSFVTSTSNIIYSRKTTGGTPGQVSITAQSAGSFTLTSTGNETSTFYYSISN